jgi:hypothetical protein
VSPERDDDFGWGFASWMRAYSLPGAAFLAERTARRIASYQRDLANLTRQGSAEPRLWVGCVQTLWSGLADDYGDFLRAYGGFAEHGDLTEVSAAAPPIVTARINEGAKTGEQSFDLPRALFDGGTKVRLVTSGLYIGTRRVLHPRSQVVITPEEVSASDGAAKIRFLNLPNDLTAGMTLVGTIVGERVKRHAAEEDAGGAAQPSAPHRLLVAVVEARIV